MPSLGRDSQHGRRSFDQFVHDGRLGPAPYDTGRCGVVADVGSDEPTATVLAVDPLTQQHHTNAEIATADGAGLVVADGVCVFVNHRNSPTAD